MTESSNGKAERFNVVIRLKGDRKGSSYKIPLRYYALIIDIMSDAEKHGDDF